MLGLRPCPRGRLLVVLAVLALGAIALVPRGLVRATAASHLPGPATLSEGVAPAPHEGADLPGVRALVAREEQDTTHLVIRLFTSAAPGDIVTASAPVAEWRLPEQASPPVVCADPPLVCGSRAPPRSI